MSTAFYVILFILSIIIAHFICSSLGFIGTMSGIIQLKIGIWIVVFACLALIVNLTGIAPKKDKAETKVEQEQITQNESEGDNSVQNTDEFDENYNAEYEEDSRDKYDEEDDETGEEEASEKKEATYCQTAVERN